LKEIPTATVVVAVFRQAGTNAVEVAQSIEKLIPTIQQTLPNSVTMKTILRSIAIDRQQRVRR